MKQVYVLRHGPKDKSGKLTEEGKEYIKSLATTFGPFSLIISSEVERAQETAYLLTNTNPQTDSRANIIDITEEEEAELFELGKSNTYGIAGAIFANEKYRKMAQGQGQKLVLFIKETLEKLVDGQKALIISHDAPMAAAERILQELTLDRIERNFKPVEGYSVDENLHITHITH